MNNILFPETVENLRKISQNLIWEDELVRLSLSLSEQEKNTWLISYEDLEEHDFMALKITYLADNDWYISEKEGALFAILDKAIDNDNEKIAAVLSFLHSHSTVLEATVFFNISKSDHSIYEK